MRQRKNAHGRGSSTKRAGLIHVPAHPKPLEALRPAPSRPKSVHERVWNLPLALESLSVQHKFFSKDVQKAGGVNQSTVSRWLNYQGLEGVSAATLLAVERGLALPEGSLLPAGITLSDLTVPRLAEITGLGVDVISELQSHELGERMNTLAEEVRRAVVGVSSVYGITLERGAAIAMQLVRKHRLSAAKSREFGASFWFDRIREEALKTPTDQSGTHPSVGKIAIVKPAGKRA